MAAAREYDVFLRFRGADTRRTFVSHLYAALHRRGLAVFSDDPRPQRGDPISEELRRAITKSRVVIVEISETYASSRWCLDELQMIMELQMNGNLKVVPIFYGVEPSDAERQTGIFGASFRRFEDSETAERVQKWREALTQLANLPGFDSRDCEDEAKMIEQVVEGFSAQAAAVE